MLKPKKRKLPQSKKTRLNKLRKVLTHSPLQAIFNVQNEKDSAIINKVYDLEMFFNMDESKKVINQFFIDHGYSINQAGIFVPESTVLKAYSYSDLIIALKMQQVECTDWTLNVDSYFFDPETDGVVIVPYSVNLNGIGYFEIYQELKIKVDRGAGIKTRWRGLEAELKKAHDEYGTDGLMLARTEMHFSGKCKFRNIDAYEEFMYLKGMRESGKIEMLFEAMNKDAVEQGLLDENLQPLKHDLTGLPVNIIKHYRKKYEDNDIELGEAFRVGYR